MALLHVDRLSVAYAGIPALSGVSLLVDAGEIVGVIGVNRAGKTTLLRAISGLVSIGEGAVSFDGHRIDGLPGHARPGLGIAHVPEGRQVFPGMSVEENLILGAVTPRSRGRRSAQLASVYDLFPRLAERRAQPARTLSGGEQQMLALGRALMLQPRLLMLDEPSMGLAPKVVEEVYERIREIRELGIAILLIEQNVPMALAVISRGYVLDQGAITIAGPAAGLRADRRIQEAFLGI
jgi:branched-chain amino acid transport system ATP-binding protein